MLLLCMCWAYRRGPWAHPGAACRQLWPLSAVALTTARCPPLLPTTTDRYGLPVFFPARYGYTDRCVHYDRGNGSTCAAHVTDK